PRRLPAVRRRGEEADLVAGLPIQGHRLVRDGLRRQEDRRGIQVRGVQVRGQVRDEGRRGRQGREAQGIGGEEDLGGGGVRLDGIRVEAPPAPSPPRPSSPRGRGGRNTKNHAVVVVLAVLFVLGVPVRRGGVWASEIILKAGHVTMP